jgi:AraC-like DNA-binding protein
MLIRWFNGLFEQPKKTNKKMCTTVLKSSKYACISETLDEYCEAHPFIKPGFNLSTIANDTNIPYYVLTSYFNNYLGVPFNEWKNGLRIDYAVNKIKQGEAKNYTLETIARQCGFLSRSNFYNSFYKRMNVKPSEYIKQF